MSDIEAGDNLLKNMNQHSIIPSQYISKSSVQIEQKLKQIDHVEA